MVVENLSARTIVSYLNAPRQLIRYWNLTPDQITSDQIMTFLVYLKEEKKQKRNTMRIAVNGIRYLYKNFLDRPTICDQIPYPKTEFYLPEVFTGKELLKLFRHTTNTKHRVLLKLIYSAGLRREEARTVRVYDINTKTRQIHIRSGKGNRDRYVTLAFDMIFELENYIKKYRPKEYLFCGRTKNEPISASAMRWALCQALKREGLARGLNIHSLRHSFATHLLSLGTNLLVIKRLLGHSDIRTTMIYLHINDQMNGGLTNPLDILFPKS